MFEYPAGGKNISNQLLHLSQNNRTAADYAVEFRTLAAQSSWNDISLKAMFQQSLSPELQIELACKGDDLLFSEYVNLAIRVDNLMRQAPRRWSARGVQQSHLTPAFNVSTPETTISDEPMQLNFSRLSEEERARCRQFHLCFYCGEAGHRSSGCPHKSQTTSRVNIEHFALLSNKSFTLPVTLRTENLSANLTAMIDSGAALNLINKDITQKYNIPV